MSFSSQLILVSILKELAKEKLQISYLIENAFLITVDVKELAKEKLQISTLIENVFLKEVDLKELAKEKLQISYLIENVFLITVDSGKHSEGIGQGETTDQLTSLRMSFSSQLILVSILKELTKEKLQISYLIENVFLITVDSGKYSERNGQGETTDQLPH